LLSAKKTANFTPITLREREDTNPANKNIYQTGCVVLLLPIVMGTANQRGRFTGGHMNAHDKSASVPYLS
jgi:hypothetical protein